MAPLSRDAPNSVCIRCSKPIRPGTAAQYAGSPVHVRCLARATVLEAIEGRDRARSDRQRARALVDQASNQVEQAREVQRTCSVCERSLKDGGSLLFQGDVLVHAICWRPEPDPARAEAASCAVCHRPLLSAGGHMIDSAGRHFHMPCPPPEP